MINVFGSRVRQARVLRRMTAGAVAREMGWSSSRQTKIEQGAVFMLPPADFDRLSALLRFPTAFFTSEPRTRVTPADLLFRAPKSMTKGEQDALATFASLAGDFVDDLDAQTKLPPVRVPTVTGTPDSDLIVLAATRTRQAMGLDPHEPIDDLMYEVERIGAPIIVRQRNSSDWPGEFSATLSSAKSERHLGYSCWGGPMRDRPLLVLRESESWERTRFTVAHELGHLVLHSNACNDSGRDQEEEANRFAAEFLAPHTVLATELPPVMSLLNLKPMKDKWGLSLGSLIRHLKDTQIIEAARAEMMATQLYTRKNPETGHSWGVTEPGWNERTVERPRLLSKWSETCYGAASTSRLVAREANILPIDILDGFMVTQRSAPGSEPPTVAAVNRVASAPVVSLDQWRIRKI